jgi:hypothetical protein
MPASVEGMPGADQQGLFAGLGPGFGTTVWRPLVERGRLADPARADEITVNQEYANLARVHVGDTVRLTGSAGIDQRATVVGIHRSPLDIGPNGGAPSAFATPAFVDRWWSTLAALPGFDELRLAVAIRFRRGADVDAALHRLAESLPPEVGLVGPEGLEGDVRDGLRAATTAYLVLALTAGVGSVLVLSLLLARSMRARRDESALLAALGATRRDRAVATWIPHAAAVTVGIVAAPVLATLASPLVRTGFAALADPVGGIWVEVPVLLAATATLAIALLTAAAASAWRASALSDGRAIEPARVSRLDWVEHASPAAAIGARAALGGIGAGTRRLARHSFPAIVVPMACLMAALVWISSAQQLAHDFSLQGWNFDAVAAGDPGATAESVQQAGDALRARDDLAELVHYRQATVPLHGVDVDVISLADERGVFTPVLTNGRAPLRANEVAIGPDIARREGVTVGDILVLPGASEDVPTTIVGEVVFPAVGNTSFGGEILMTDETLAAIVAEPPNGGYLVGLRPGADLAQLERALGDGLTLERPFSPPPIVRLHDATGISMALVGFFALLGAAVLAFTMVTSTQRQRFEYAVARALGFDRRQVHAACRWHVGIVLFLCVVVALPLGVVAGRMAWTLSSRNLAVLHVSSVPFAELGMAALGAALLGVTVSQLVATGPARMTIARTLRAE